MKTSSISKKMIRIFLIVEVFGLGIGLLAGELGEINFLILSVIFSTIVTGSYYSVMRFNLWIRNRFGQVSEERIKFIVLGGLIPNAMLLSIAVPPFWFCLSLYSVPAVLFEWILNMRGVLVNREEDFFLLPTKLGMWFCVPSWLVIGSIIGLILSLARERQRISVVRDPA